MWSYVEIRTTYSGEVWVVMKGKLEIPLESDIRTLERNTNKFIKESSYYSSSITWNC
jgi:hypothetical protein